MLLELAEIKIASIYDAININSILQWIFIRIEGDMHRRYFFSLCKIDEEVENEKFKNVTETLKKMAKREGTTVKIQLIHLVDI